MNEKHSRIAVQDSAGDYEIIKTADPGHHVVLGKYLGDGGCATVYQGEYSYKNDKNEKFVDPVAVKIVRSSVQTMIKVHDEMEILKDLYSRGIKVPKLITWSYPKEDGTISGLVMELLDAQTYDDTYFELPELMPRIMEIGETFDHINRSGYIHLDIKPGNISIHDRHRILDFGLARSLRQESTRTKPDSIVIGTEKYMAPEQTFLDIRLTPKTDQYQWARCVQELLEQSAPSCTYRRYSIYDNKSLSETQMCARIRRRQFSPLQINNPGYYPSFADDLNDILEKAQRRYPDDRYQSIGAMMGDFGEVLKKTA